MGRRGRIAALSIVAVVFVTSCSGAADESTTQAPTTTTTPAVDDGGAVEVFGTDTIDSLVWWSTVPGRGMLVYASVEENGRATLVSVTPDGDRSVIREGLRPVIEGLATPDGASLVIVESPGGGRGPWSLWTIDLTTGAVTRLDETVDRIVVDLVTPESGAVLYRRFAEGRTSLHAAPLSGGRVHTLGEVTATRRGDAFIAAPQIVGGLALFQMGVGTELLLWSAGLDGDEARMLVSPVRVETVYSVIPTDDEAVVLAQVGLTEGEAESALFAIFVDGRHPAVLLDDGAGDPTGVVDVRADRDWAIYRIGETWFAANIATTRRFDTGFPPEVVNPPGYTGWVDTIEAVPSGYLFTSRADSGNRELYHFDPGTDVVKKVSAPLESHRGVLGQDSAAWVLEFDPMGDGRHVAYTTGLAGEDRDLAYRLFVVPLP